MISGCGGNALLIRPVSDKQQLEETQISRDEGLFVFDKIAVIDVDGIMANKSSAGLLQAGENPVSLFIEKLDRAAADKDVKAVVLRINSPGGTVVASDLMHHALLTFKKNAAKPVIACVLDVGASGAYYLACACDTIYAAPSSVLGSIGTIMQTVSFAGTMRLLGITAEAIKSGELKDMGSPLRNLTDQERKVLTEVIMHHYDSFIDVVLTGRRDRGLNRRRLLELADGRVFTAAQALENKLIDKIGYPADALADAKQRAGVTKAKVVIYHRPLGYKPNFYASADQLNPPSALINLDLPYGLRAQGPQFLYLWQIGEFN
ncbi:MAG: hypothetical protein AMJ79_03715 [Phycisphaerae bacterium SM23_30]|nr:MAG: hypothetical protein AMJ79_03715 [Phycisphaerae bacterium SM23_30]